MAQVYERYMSRLTGQANSSIAVDGYNTSTPLVIDKAASANANGAQWFDVYIDVTAAPSSDASCELWIAGSSDGTDETAYEYALTCAVPHTGGVDQFRLGCLYSTPREFRGKIKAIGYAFSATLYFVPVYAADA